MNCPHCGHQFSDQDDFSPVEFDLRDTVRVRGKVYAEHHSGQIGKRPVGRGRWLRAVPVIYVQEKESDYGNLSMQSNGRKPQTPKISTRNSPVPALSKNIPANRRSKVPVLQEDAR